MNHRGTRAGRRDGGGIQAGEAQRACSVYASVRDVLRGDMPATANIGLIYDRYADVWSGAPTWTRASNQRFLDDVIKHARRVAPRVAPLLQALHERRAILWRAVGARVLELSLAAPMVSGLGMTHALEAGFVWDRNLGIPYLPASSLKGVARAWAEQGWAATEDQCAVPRIFGAGPKEVGGDSVGSVVFHALYPIKPPRLRLDVVNPHFGDYYRGKSSAADYLEPIPTFFLTVAAREAFRTALHLRPGAPPGDVDLAEEWLRAALTTLGVGAKTGVGYGLFERPSR